MAKTKLLKTGVKMSGQYFGKTFYEYGFFDKEERAQLTKNYEKYLAELIVKRRKNPKKWGLVETKPIKYPLLRDFDGEIETCSRNHVTEGILEIIKKSNGNVQVVVENIIPEPEAVPEIPEISAEEAVEIEKAASAINKPPETKPPAGPPAGLFEQICKCGFIAKTKSGLQSHQRFCKVINAK